MTHIPEYVQAIIFAVVFLMFINGGIGSILLYVIIGAGLLSAASVIFSKKRFTVTLRGLSGVTECGRPVEFRILVKKTGFCFIPDIELCVDAEESIHLRTSLLFRREAEITGTFVPSHSGLNKVTLKNAVICDFLGNLRLSVPLDQQTQIAVLPRIVEYDGPEVMPSMLPSNDEEREEGLTVFNGGMPGYEHREYTEGDSPRRINYKLSAKRHKLMVRLDESSGYASVNLFIAGNAFPICAEKAFALASRLVIRGGTVKVLHSGEERFASSPETLDRMREWLAFREYAREPLPPDTDVDSDVNVVFSGNGEIMVRTPG